MTRPIPSRRGCLTDEISVSVLFCQLSQASPRLRHCEEPRLARAVLYFLRQEDALSYVSLVFPQAFHSADPSTPHPSGNAELVCRVPAPMLKSIASALRRHDRRFLPVVLSDMRDALITSTLCSRCRGCWETLSNRATTKPRENNSGGTMERKTA